MNAEEARRLVGVHLKALSVACDEMQTALFQESDMRWRRLVMEDPLTWPPIGDYLFWAGGHVEGRSSRENTGNSSRRVFSSPGWESKWPQAGWWMPYPPPPPSDPEPR